MTQTAGSLFSFVRRVVVSIISSLKATLLHLGAAIRQHSLAKLLDLLKGGSPLEDLIDSVLVAVFWVLLLAPALLVPIYYLALSVMQR
jgi:adenylate kinase